MIRRKNQSANTGRAKSRGAKPTHGSASEPIESGAEANSGTAASKMDRFSVDAKTLYQSIKLQKNRKFLVLSVVFHLVIMIVFFSHWSSDETKPIVLPKSVTVRAATAQELQAIANARQRVKDKENAEKREKALARKKEKERVQKEKELKQKRLKEKKRKEKLRKEAERKKKAEADKIKKAEAQRKKEAARKAQIEKEREVERLRKEKIAEKVEAAKKAADRKWVEDKLRKRLEQIQAAKNAETEAKANDIKAGELEQELSEVEYYMGVIRSRIENRWRVPPRTKGLRVVLRLKLLPTGELAGVSLSQSSGVSAFDNSALHAVNNVGKFPVPKDNAIFERNFRSFSMGFTSPYDGL